MNGFPGPLPDHLHYYYNETIVDHNGGFEKWVGSKTHAVDGLSFFDKPSQPHWAFIYDGAAIEFETRLVGVKTDGSYIMWGTDIGAVGGAGWKTNFRWKSNGTHEGGGGATVDGGWGSGGVVGDRPPLVSGGIASVWRDDGEVIFGDWPVAIAGGPYTGSEGSPVTLDASASSAPGGGTLQYRWDFNDDGQWDTDWLADPIVTYTWDDNWTGEVRLQVSDGTIVADAFAYVAIHNVPPVATLSNDGPVTYGQAVTVSLINPFDPSPVDTEAGFRYALAFDPDALETVTYNDESTWEDSWTIEALDAGEYTVYGRIIDKDDGFTQYETTLIVDKAPLTIAANDTTKIYGQPNPAFTVSYDGFVLGQDESVLSGMLTFDTNATQSSDVGVYGVFASGLTSENYEIEFVGGCLIILQAPQTIHWDDPEPILQGTPLSETQLNATVSVVGPDPAGELTYDPAAGTVLPAGFHTLTVTAAETWNYLPATATVEIIVSGVSLVDGTLWIVGTHSDDWVHINGHGRNQIRVHTDFYATGSHQSFSVAAIDRIIAHLLDGDDHMTIAGNVTVPTLIRGGSGDNFIHTAGGPAILIGGTGNDVLQGGAGRNILIGGGGSNTLRAGRSGDVLVGGSTSLDDDDDALFDLLTQWNSDESLEARIEHIIDSLIVEYDDEEQNTFYGGAGHDLIFADLDDLLSGNPRAYTVVR